MSDALRLDKRKARVAARGAADARRWQRVEIPLKARFLAPDGTPNTPPCWRIFLPAGRA